MRIRIWATIWPMIVIGWSSPSLCAEAGWPSSLTIGTASPGGVYLVYGNALAPILANALGVPVTRRKQRKVLIKTYCCSKAATCSWPL